MHNFRAGEWSFVTEVNPRSFICWNCGNKIASEKAYYSNSGPHRHSHIYLCPNCNAPIVLDDRDNKPLSQLPGAEIKNLPESINNVYGEVRKCMQSNSSTGAVMLMRKIIMNIAVHEGADESLSFAQYVDYLYNEGIVPKKSKSKADSVRNLGNSANHEIENRTEEEAKNCFEFIELLLKVNYEFADEL